VSKHNSPILIEVALFFKSTSRNTRAMASRISAFDFDALDLAAKKAAEYLQKVRGRPVAPSPAAVLDLAQFDEPLPETPADACSVVEFLDRLGAPATVANAGGRFFGFVNGGALPVAVAAAWIASAWDQNVALRVMSPAAAALEDVAIRWVRDALGLPCECSGSIVTGASLANLTGLAAARHALLKRSGWDAENDGLFAAPQLAVVVGEQVHASLFKALGLLGLGRKRVIRVPADEQGRMRVDGMPALNDRTIVCIQAGNVNSGAFDPAKAICERARAAGAWVHVDGAFGLWAAASPRYRHLTEGFDLADSWATDGHKWPNVGYDCGIALVRNANAVQAAMSVSAAYFRPGELREPSNYTPEMSRRARGVELWATLRCLGRRGLAELIERTCRHALRFADGLRQARYEILNQVVINQVLVSFGEPEVTRAVIARVQADGTCWCGNTEWQGRTAMRISVSSWATTDEDVEMSLSAMLRIAEECRR
jgi:glutamate/tyrosine decarboxylase-like PLP-dependent enzyme